MTPLTVRLNNGQRVAAKMHQTEGYPARPSALTYANLTQARAAAARLGGEVIGRWPFYVRLNDPAVTA